MLEQTITRSDGITYTRKIKENNFDCHLNIKFNKDKIEELKTIASRKGIKYNALIRNILYDYIDKNL